MDSYIKREAVERLVQSNVIALSSGSDEFSSDGSDNELNPKKKLRMESLLPAGFLDPIRPNPTVTENGNNSLVPAKQEKIDNLNNYIPMAVNQRKEVVTTVAVMPSCKQFWKAGDYEGCGDSGKLYDEEMDHVRVHPKFLHSNATSHKWALGAFAELLDNALDETCNGATYVDVDVLENLKNQIKMVVVQDNGGGMTPDKMRQCMSLGYSAKSKIANTIGQYGNGFKTSTMRLGADVIVFSRCEAKYGGRAMQSIGLLSFTFLKNTGKEDIVVPMVDFEKRGNYWTKLVKSSFDNWQINLDTIVQWSPYQTEEDLLQQFDFLSDKGTRIVIYNLWEDDEGNPELDFVIDQHDIQLRGGDRDEKKIQIAKNYSSSTHFLTYRHSLRSYASILYRRLPPGFRIIIRGKDVVHHDIASDLIHIQTISYKPAAHADIKDPNMSATVTLGFVKDAKHHIDIQGFNVYHKNRLIKPFWRVWNAAGSDGRGVIGVLEANFIEPAHDKQGFERTVALSRLENRLVHFQKTYWSTNCQLIGYAQRRRATSSSSPDRKAGSAKPSSRRKGHGTAAERSDPEANCDNVTVQPQPDRVAASVCVKNERLDGDEPSTPPTSSNTDLHDLKLENERLRCENDALQNELEHMKKKMDQMDEQQEEYVRAFMEERGRRQVEEETLRQRLKDALSEEKTLRQSLKDANGTIHALLTRLKITEGRLQG